jgi:hypothetical protein
VEKMDHVLEKVAVGRGAMEREEDGQPRWGAVEMPEPGRREERHGGMAERLSWHYGGEPSGEDEWMRGF